MKLIASYFDQLGNDPIRAAQLRRIDEQLRRMEERRAHEETGRMIYKALDYMMEPDEDEKGGFVETGALTEREEILN